MKLSQYNNNNNNNSNNSIPKIKNTRKKETVLLVKYFKMPLKQEKNCTTHNNINNNINNYSNNNIPNYNNNNNNNNNNNIKGNESIANPASIISTASTIYVTATPANALTTINQNNSTTSSAEIIELKCKLESVAASVDKKSPVSAQTADMAAEQRTIAYQANAKLCRLVRKCPWMYDRHHHNYGKKNILDKSWTKIAKECNDSVPSCKERWRNIRAAFARSINIYKTHSGPNRIKPYYLHKELSFLVKPMMEGRDRRDDFDDDTRNDMDMIKEDEMDDYDDDGLEHSSGNADLPDDTIDIKSAFEALNPTIHIHSESFPRLSSNNNSTYNNDTINNNNNNNYDNHDNSNNFNNSMINSTNNSAVNVNNSNVVNNEFEAAGLFDAETEFTSDPEIEFNYNDEPSDKRQAFPNINSNNNLKNTNNQHNSTGQKRSITSMDADGIEIKRSKFINTNAQTSEADAQFLEALLPDMALMNIRQKIVFKRKIYQTLEDVFENATDFPIVNTSKEYNTNISTNAALNSSIPLNSNMPLTSNIPLSSSNDPAKAAISNVGASQVRQTILTVNSSTARSLINNIATLNESDLQKVNNFLQNSIQNSVTGNRYINGGIAPVTPSSTAVRLMHSAPKITITKVSCPPPASLRNLNTHTPPPILQPQHLQSYSTPLASKLFITPTTHSLPLTTAASTAANTNPTQLLNNENTKNNVNGNSQWNTMLPVTIKDEVEDVDID